MLSHCEKSLTGKDNGFSHFMEINDSSGLLIVNDHSKQKILFESKFCTSSFKCSDIIQHIKSVVSNNRLLPAMSDYEFTLVIDEAITNAIEHGNNGDPDKVIRVSVRADLKSLHIAVEDEGKGFDYKHFRSECAR